MSVARTSDPFSEMIKNAVREVLNEFGNQPKRIVYTEDEVMEMLGIQSKATMAKLRNEGLIGHKVCGRARVYLHDDLVDFIRMADEW